MRKKPVGSAEICALRRLLATDGVWSSQDRPLWESKYWTTQLLCSLSQKGLVKEVVADEQYEITPAGVEAAQISVATLTSPGKSTAASRRP